jgi:DNA-binding CsgD family transcriptional regulator
MNVMTRARLWWIDSQRTVREHRLDATTGPIRVGRHPACEVCIDDSSVSRHHLLLTPVGETWFVEDVADGTTEFERRERAALLSRRSLLDGDRLYVGRLTLVYKDEDELELGDTEHAELSRVALTRGERSVLDQLCKPVIERTGPPASNKEIAAALFLSIDGVRSHLKSMYGKFGIAEGTAAQRRAALVRNAIDGRYVPPR